LLLALQLRPAKVGGSRYQSKVGVGSRDPGFGGLDRLRCGGLLGLQTGGLAARVVGNLLEPPGLGFG